MENKYKYNMSDWEKAGAFKRRAFYERSTETLRLYPENYCLAHRANSASKWYVYRDEFATMAKHTKIQDTLDTWQNGSTGDALADELGKLFQEVK